MMHQLSLEKFKGIFSIAGFKKILSPGIFALLIQTNSPNFANIKSNTYTWDFLIGLHKK